MIFGRSSRKTSLLGVLAPLLCLVATACGPATGEAEWPPVAKQWYERGDVSFRTGDLDDAETATANALRAAPGRVEVRLLAARIALAKLEYDRAIQFLKGLGGGEARAIRGRAYWYQGDVDRAADELEALIADPSVRDAWATEIAKLARRGQGRKPFEMSGGLLAATEMPRAGTTLLIVPLELNGEPALGLIHTGTAEAVIDASKGSEPSWVSLRFGERIQVRDVPALAQDLSGLSRMVNAPIKILIGVNLLRHLNPTFDFAGGQFVVRSFEPPPPPQATTVKLNYVRGGGMLVRGACGVAQAQSPCSFLVDTSVLFPLELDEAGWKKAGVSPSSLRTVPNSGNLKQGVVPMLKLGAFDVPGVPGLSGDARVKEREEGLGIELDGLVGSGLLASFRVTLADGGRTMWLEDMPREALVPPPALTADPGLVDEGEPEPELEEEPEPPAKPGAKPAAKPGAKPGAAPAPKAPAAPAANPPGAAKKPAPTPPDPKTQNPISKP